MVIEEPENQRTEIGLRIKAAGRLHARNIDEQNKDLLKMFSRVFSQDITSFSDLHDISEQRLRENLNAFVSAVNHYPDESMDSYVIDKLIWDREDIGFETLKDLFLDLKPSNKEYLSYARQSIANMILNQLTATRADDFLELMKSQEQTKKDRAILLLGIPKVYNKVNAELKDEFLMILRTDTVDGTNIAFCAEVARKIKAADLLNLFEKALPKIQEKEIKREVLKTIDYLAN
jgi:hypothetical protein